MPKIIKDSEIIEDVWHLIDIDADINTAISDEPTIVPLAVWQQQREQLSGHPQLGICLNSDESPSLIKDDIALFKLIAINFPQFADGRGFSYGRELKEQHHFTGELRAVGDFMRDQLGYLKRCGFNAFALENTDLEAAISSLNDFSEYYQSSIDQPLPLFKRR
jgi:uncharacterized protein (DUF934 family)